MFGKEKQGNQGVQGVQGNQPKEEAMAAKETKAEVKETVNTETSLVPTRPQADVLSFIAPDEQSRTLLAAQLKACPEARREAFMKMFRMMSPDKPGMDSDMDRRWSPARMRIHQAVSRDNIPDGSKLGDLYTSAGKHIKSPFKFVPIFFHRGRIMFQDNQLKCGSNDGVTSRDGVPCSSCPHDKEKNPNGSAVCPQTIEVFVIDELNENTYILSFSKAGFLEGERLRKLATANEFPWEQWFTLSSKETTVPGKKYFSYSVGVTNEKVDPTVQNVLYSLSTFIQRGRDQAKTELAQRKLLATTRVSDVGAAAGPSVPAVEGTPDFGGSL